MKFPRAIILALLLAATVGAFAHAQEKRPSPSSAKASDCVATMGALPKPFDGVAFAIDGNTLAVAGLRPRVRIWGIQAPELCVAKTTDIGGRMIDNGMAYGFDLHDVDKADVPLSLSYAESEAAARKEMRGLWPEWLGKK